MAEGNASFCWPGAQTVRKLANSPYVLAQFPGDTYAGDKHTQLSSLQFYLWRPASPTGYVGRRSPDAERAHQVHPRVTPISAD